MESRQQQLLQLAGAVTIGSPKNIKIFKQLQVLMSTVRQMHCRNFGISHNVTTGERSNGHHCTVKMTCRNKPLSPRMAGDVV